MIVSYESQNPSNLLMGERESAVGERERGLVMCIEQEAAEKSTITMLPKTQEHDAVVKESQGDPSADFIRMKRSVCGFLTCVQQDHQEACSGGIPPGLLHTSLGCSPSPHTAPQYSQGS